MFRIQSDWDWSTFELPTGEEIDFGEAPDLPPISGLGGDDLRTNNSLPDHSAHEINSDQHAGCNTDMGATMDEPEVRGG